MLQNEKISPYLQKCLNQLIYREIHYQTEKLAGFVGGTETTQNHIGMQGHKQDGLLDYKTNVLA